MRRFSLACLCLLLLGFSSNSEAQSLTSDQTQHLYLLAQSWSTAKNYHSGTCQLDWDDELLKAIPAILAERGADGFNEQLSTLLNTLGQNAVSGTQPIDTPAFLQQPTDRSWLQDPTLDDANRDWLTRVISEFRPRSNCHVGVGPVGQPNFEQDDGFHNDANPSLEVRLLGLFRYWNIIDVYFPYKNLMDEPWNEVLREFIPRVHEANDGLAYQKVMREFTAHIQDSHAFFYSPYFNGLINQRYLPFVLKTIEGRLVIYRHTDSELLGAEVLSINGRSIAELIEEYSLLVAASNPSTLTREVDRLLNQGSGAASLRVRRDGIEQVIETRYQLIGQRSLYENTQPYFAMDQQACSVGYVDMGLLSTPDVAPMMAAFNNKDAIVFDLRNYPNGTLWTLVDYLYSGPIQVASFGFPEISSPGDYSQRGATIGSFHFNDIYSGRVLILMNEETQSQAEYTIMGLEQHPNAVKIGSQTAAADGDIAEVKLPGNISTWFTALGVYYPDRTPTQRVGIVPDLFIRPTIDGVSRGEDEVLNSALNCQNIRNSDWPTDPEPRAGLYWDPDKSGKGIDIHAANGNHVIYAYDFREDGSPVWYQGFSDTSSGALRIDQGSLFEYTYDYGNRTVEALTPDDTMRFDFKRGVFEIDCAEGSPELLTSPAQLLWQTEDGLESRCLEKMRFSFAPTPINYTGLWYGGPEDSGWGFSISHEGDVMVVLLYYYDDAGQATWAIASGVRDGNSPLTMGLIQVAGFCIICEVQEVELTEIGTLTISLTSNSEDSADNWVSLQLDDDSPWNRDRMPISRLTAPVEDA